LQPCRQGEKLPLDCTASFNSQVCADA
jgi:hypothetical protein